jgi:hypothetical protein
MFWSKEKKLKRLLFKLEKYQGRYKELDRLLHSGVITGAVINSLIYYAGQISAINWDIMILRNQVDVQLIKKMGVKI